MSFQEWVLLFLQVQNIGVLLFAFADSSFTEDDVCNQAYDHKGERTELYWIVVCPAQEVAEYQNNRSYYDNGKTECFEIGVHNMYIVNCYFSDYKVTHNYSEKEIFFLKFLWVVWILLHNPKVWVDFQRLLWRLLEKSALKLCGIKKYTYLCTRV